ncbi:glycerol-3-phosphate dehydrogenase/oxidase [Paenalcaligenes hermetiae]|uniref:Glycerol-3-phosphate dehydrogenase/oxidase n=2 Tax=Paenalcaligenes hermetiae TaxID=1157987 RepID=A0ABP9MA43_9BURK
MAALARINEVDLIVIGGGATGLGIAVDASARGLSVVLLESHDFAKGTSSRATKLVHGGVRYLAQGNIALVREALHERTTLLRNAPHLASPLGFVMPSYKCWETPFYGIGLKAYDALAGQDGLGSTRFLGRRQALAALPGVKENGLKGGVMYWDGQFDDARLALALARTAAANSALVVNYCPVVDLLYDNQQVAGVICEDAETEERYTIHSRCVINATGVWVDDLRRTDAQHTQQPVQSLVSPSQGVHLVVDREFLPSEHALLVPKTADGRVLFAVPWLGKVILGTTDTPRHDLAREPAAFEEEITFILSEAANYLAKAPTRADVRSVWVGLRPLVKADSVGSTKQLSREHTILSSSSGLVTVTGGKWTTYRAMAEDVLKHCTQQGVLGHLAPSTTKSLVLVGAPVDRQNRSLQSQPDARVYGSEAAWVQSLDGADQEILPGLSQAMVRFAVRYEYARTVEDVLARRSRWLFLDARQSAQAAPHVAEILEQEGIETPRLAEFLALCNQYQLHE